MVAICNQHFLSVIRPVKSYVRRGIFHLGGNGKPQLRIPNSSGPVITNVCGANSSILRVFFSQYFKILLTNDLVLKYIPFLRSHWDALSFERVHVLSVLTSICISPSLSVRNKRAFISAIRSTTSAWGWPYRLPTPAETTAAFGFQ